jgi:hypothetical protein
MGSTTQTAHKHIVCNSRRTVFSVTLCISCGIYPQSVFAIVFMHTWRNSRFGRALFRHVSLITIIILAGAGMSPLASTTAEAVFHTLVSDTISNSSPGVASNHVVAWTSASTVTSGQTIKIQFDTTGDSFDLSSVVSGDISITGMSLVANFGACNVGPDEVYATIDSAAPDESVTLTTCTGDTVSLGAKTVTIGNLHLLNPATPGSYNISIAGTQADNGLTRVAIIGSITMSAKVETQLTFNIAGLGIGQTINGATTSTSTTGTVIGFGTLVPHSPVVAGQELTVSTNAVGGFIVTVQETQNLVSVSTADIDTFKDGTETATPAVWTAPITTLGNEDTYGHIGLTSNDTDLNAGEFVGQKYAGNFLSAPRIIFGHDGASDGITQDIGIARVAYKIEITPPQEAADDYSNQLIYVCTPSF